MVIAAALAQAADVLLLDEPTASLDLAYQLEIASLIGRLNRELGCTVVLSTHDLNLAAAVCGHLVLIREGRTLASGPTNEVLTAGNIRRTFDVEAEVSRHAAAGHLIVVPLPDRRGASA